MSKLIINVKEIKGKCPVYEVGDKIVLDEGYQMNMDETDGVCMHSLCSVMPYYAALFRGVKPTDLGLAESGDNAYVQCLDPCQYTGGGTVVFEIEKKKID
jgi:uncharacterized repeat protein (TIGR04076 family)